MDASKNVGLPQDVQLLAVPPLQVKQVASQLVQTRVVVSPYCVLGQGLTQLVPLRKYGLAQVRQFEAKEPLQVRHVLLQFTQVRVGEV